MITTIQIVINAYRHFIILQVITIIVTTTDLRVINAYRHFIILQGSYLKRLFRKAPQLILQLSLTIKPPINKNLLNLQQSVRS